MQAAADGMWCRLIEPAIHSGRRWAKGVLISENKKKIDYDTSGNTHMGTYVRMQRYDKHGPPFVYQL